MKKCKITVLKRNFDEELAREYGVEGLTACPMLKEGQVFMPTGNVPKGFVMKLGKQFINMSLHLLMVEQQKNYFITVTG
jgi:uncharacterized repeat protein (TIGR04076 family)